MSRSQRSLFAATCIRAALSVLAAGLLRCALPTIGPGDEGGTSDARGDASDAAVPDGSADVGVDMVDSSVRDANPPDTAPDGGMPIVRVDPCVNGACYPAIAPPLGCVVSTVDDDFSTGRYNVHAYSTSVAAGVPVRVTLRVLGGTWQPALVVGRAGQPAFFVGSATATDGALTVRSVLDGQTGDRAVVTLTSATDESVVVYATSWAVAGAGFTGALPTVAAYRLVLDPTCATSGGHVAPAGAIAGEATAGAGPLSVDVGGAGWGTAARVDARAGEHLGFRLALPSEGSVEMELLMWDGAAPAHMRTTNFGDGTGLRMLATRDPVGDRTFWVRARGRVGGAALTVSRTPLSENVSCTAACGDLLQLPIPVDADVQGYDSDPGATLIYQFGRREIMQAILHAGRRVVGAGYRPFTLKDLSRHDGTQPPDHATHGGGYHADVGLYDRNGAAIWTALCPSGSASCTADRFGAAPLTLAMAAFFEGRMTSTIYLDCAYHDVVCATATSGPDAASIGAREREYLCRPRDLPCPTPTMTLSMPPAYPLRHVPSHEHHFHVRVDGY